MMSPNQDLYDWAWRAGRKFGLWAARTGRRVLVIRANKWSGAGEGGLWQVKQRAQHEFEQGFGSACDGHHKPEAFQMRLWWHDRGFGHATGIYREHYWVATDVVLLDASGLPDDVYKCLCALAEEFVESSYLERIRAAPEDLGRSDFARDIEADLRIKRRKKAWEFQPQEN